MSADSVVNKNNLRALREKLGVQSHVGIDRKQGLQTRAGVKRIIYHFHTSFRFWINF